MRRRGVVEWKREQNEEQREEEQKEWGSKRGGAGRKADKKRVRRMNRGRAVCVSGAGPEDKDEKMAPEAAPVSRGSKEALAAEEEEEEEEEEEDEEEEEESKDEEGGAGEGDW